jgi:cytochrome c oxidase cbb3-type subunit 3
MSPSKDEDRLLDHKYDEIQEYDNPLPSWWTLILWATIVWAVLYFFNFIPGLGTGKGRVANYDKEMAAAAEKFGTPQQQAAKAAGAIDPALVLAYVKDPAKIAAGKAIFMDPSKCVTCHVADGGGLVGPNLTDDYWIHGATPKDILTTITNGVPDKGMLTWGPILGPEKCAEVAAYVYTLHGTHPAKPKEPQGAKVEYDANGPIATAAVDSTAKPTK